MERSRLELQRRREQMDKDHQPEYEQELLLQLNIVKAKLSDLKARWPAHSLQAKMVAELEDLEDERDRILNLIPNHK